MNFRMTTIIKFLGYVLWPSFVRVHISFPGVSFRSFGILSVAGGGAVAYIKMGLNKMSTFVVSNELSIV